MAKKKIKYYKVVIVATELIPVAKKYVYVNVQKCFVKDGVIHIQRGDAEYTYPDSTCSCFMKEQKGKVDDDVSNIRPSRTKTKNKMA